MNAESNHAKDVDKVSGSRARVEALPNIGPKLAAALRAVGVRDAETLRQRGSEAVWRDMREQGLFDDATSLQALEGAVRGVRWHDLDRGLRARLVEIATDPDHENGFAADAG